MATSVSVWKTFWLEFSEWCILLLKTKHTEEITYDLSCCSILQNFFISKKNVFLIHFALYEDLLKTLKSRNFNRQFVIKSPIVKLKYCSGFINI